MMRLTRPISDEADYHSILGDIICFYISEDTNYHTSDGITGALLSGGALTNDYRLEE